MFSLLASFLAPSLLRGGYYSSAPLCTAPSFTTTNEELKNTPEFFLKTRNLISHDKILKQARD